MTITETPILEQLEREGFVRLRSVIPIHLIEKARPLAARDMQNPEIGYGPRQQPNGFQARIHEYVEIVDEVELALRQAGLRPTRLHTVSIFTQSAEGVRRYWHRDSKEYENQNDILALVYLQDTEEENGCLIVGKRHDDRFNEAADNYEVGPIEGERLVPSQLGDLIIIKPQQPHSAARNSTKDVRLLVRIWLTLASPQTN